MPLTEQRVRKMFQLLEEVRKPDRADFHCLHINELLLQGRGQEFFNNYVDPNVDWVVTGSQNPLSGHYTSRDAFQQATFVRLNKVLKKPLAVSEHLQQLQLSV